LEGFGGMGWFWLVCASIRRSCAILAILVIFSDFGRT